ncbi:ranBP-type and C3HC4-type zinc finger-containing protein 1-like [Toxorhynchites rutilus septentrionalis]|uniref:ranBP-type and C3HC4-type zinc finger-containing protein 1-like n=1 Tax=Toxorhynchites rutilus septentrionalis TaxID=329112 RepID=UPI002479F655|nr:ranBP-type and C3HC4-type zinc finger-containing protein 1-like [Toxorhynchites rutilus septentrionalis]
MDKPDCDSNLDVNKNHYHALLDMGQSALVHNTEPAECNICAMMTPTSEGVILTNCLHSFCTACMRSSLLESPSIRCPYPKGRFDCVGVLEKSEIQTLLSPSEYADFSKNLENATADNNGESRNEDLDLLVTLTDASIVPNQVPFECPVCFLRFQPYEGVILRECFHSFCRDCLMNSIKYSEDVVVRCPYQDVNTVCNNLLEDREIKCLLSDGDYSVYLGRSLTKAENLAENAFHCKTPDCVGWCLIENDAQLFECPVCSAKNCLRCKVIHSGMSCEDYQDILTGNFENRRSEEAMQCLVASGEAMHCPFCGVIIMKIAGCDYIQCGVCKTGICWVTRGPRWGPLGKNDNSGGCRCGVGGKKCHPSCQNCH